VIAPVLYDLLILAAAAHVPTTMMNSPDTIKNAFSATSSLYFIDRSVLRSLQLSWSHIHPFDVMHMNAPSRAPIKEVRSPKNGIAAVSGWPKLETYPSRG